MIGFDRFTPFNQLKKIILKIYALELPLLKKLFFYIEIIFLMKKSWKAGEYIDPNLLDKSHEEKQLDDIEISSFYGRK